MIACTRRIEFDAAHRVVDHKSKCKYLHGHRYVLEVTAEAACLDKMGMVVDFGDLKTIIKCWIDENWDHTVILHQDDSVLGVSIEKYTGQRVYYLKNNPTAENIALHFKRDVVTTLFTSGDFKITKIRLYETPNCYVEV